MKELKESFLNINWKAPMEIGDAFICHGVVYVIGESGPTVLSVSSTFQETKDKIEEFKDKVTFLNELQKI